MTTNAMIGAGTAVELARASAPTDFTYIRGVFGIKPPSFSASEEDVTDFQSSFPYRDYIPTWGDPGEISGDMNYVPGSTTDAFMRSIGGVPLVARLTFKNGYQMLCDCSLSGYEPDVPNDGKQTAPFSLKASGEPYMSPTPVAPRALVNPSIVGTAQVGVMLKAERGHWAGASSFTYQWQADTGGNGTFADISGATKSSYVPVAGDQGDDLRVRVTGVNDATSTTVSSTETAATLAAA